MKIVLASTSKYKKEILDRCRIKHISIKPLCEEISNKTNPYEYVCELALNKAKSIKEECDIVIGLDTITLIDNKIIEKPKDIDEARNNLINSSNNIVKVITGICIINNNTNEVVNEYDETIISFKEINNKDIEFYLKYEEEYMYSSGFILENIASNFIKNINGSYYNILGAPVDKIYSILNNMNIYLSDINEGE